MTLIIEFNNACKTGKLMYKYKVIVAKFKLLVKAHKKLYNCNMSSQEQLKKNVNHKNTLFQLVFGRAKVYKV